MDKQKILDQAPIIKTWAGDVDQKIKDEGERLIKEWLFNNVTSVMIKLLEEK